MLSYSANKKLKKYLLVKIFQFRDPRVKVKIVTFVHVYIMYIYLYTFIYTHLQIFKYMYT